MLLNVIAFKLVLVFADAHFSTCMCEKWAVIRSRHRGTVDVCVNVCGKRVLSPYDSRDNIQFRSFTFFFLCWFRQSPHSHRGIVFVPQIVSVFRMDASTYDLKTMTSTSICEYVSCSLGCCCYLLILFRQQQTLFPSISPNNGKHIRICAEL